RSTGKGLPLLSRFSRSIGRAGSQTETIRDITKLHGPTSRRRQAPAALERELPGGGPGSGGIESGAVCLLRRHAPAGERAGKPAPLMPREEKAWRAACLRGKPEAPCDNRRLHLDLAESGGEGAGFKPLFQGPGRVHGIARLDDENEGGIEAEGDEARSVRRAPFARGFLGQ